MVFENKCNNVGSGFARPIAFITEPGGEKDVPTSGYVIAFNFLFQKP